MNKEDKIRKIIEYKDEIDILIHQNYHKLARENGLSLEQFHLLIELDELMLDIHDNNQAPTVGELAKNINNAQNTVSERITRLENKGLVKRIKDCSDRRISRVILTDEGRSLIEQIEKQARGRFLQNCLSNMEDADIDNLERCLKKLVDQMNAIKEG